MDGTEGCRVSDLNEATEAADPPKVYIDSNDWWVGYYRGPNHHYVLLLPTVVIRWRRKPVRSLAGDAP